MKTVSNSKTTFWLSVLLFAAFVIGLIGVAAATGWQQTIEAITRLTWMQVAILLSLSLANYFLRASRWHLYIGAMGIKVPYTTSIRHYLGGFALTATPGRVGELIRLRWLWLETGRRPDSTGSLILIDRAADLTAVGLLLAFSVAMSAAGIQGAWTVSLIALMAAWVATRPLLFRSLVTTVWKVIGRFPRLFATFRRAASGLAIFSKSQIFIPSTIFGMLGWCAEATAFFLLLGWLGADCSISTAFAIFFFSMLTGGASGLPGGIGGAEAAMIALLAVQGVPFEIAIPATAIIRITTLWFAIVVGVIAFPFSERSGLRTISEEKHALE